MRGRKPTCLEDLIVQMYIMKDIKHVHIFSDSLTILFLFKLFKQVIQPIAEHYKSKIVVFCLSVIVPMKVTAVVNWGLFYWDNST